jgi:hypothetical protein
MVIEQIFAAKVFSAEKEAAEIRECGIPQTASDVIDMALSDVWQFDNTRADSISKKYVYFNADGNPQRRMDIDWGNVVPIGKKR